ncbi:flippase [Salinigranum sp. GCM10025319]|uniref:flippase n=1 Tax=Salinigranum sp. GCM10025319 TaxID=3252687 RepID=UPI00361796F2
MTSFDDALSGLAKSAAIVFLGTGLGRLLSLLGQVLIVRSLTPTSFGHVALAYTVVSMAGGLALLGVHEGVTRLMSAEQSPRYRRHVLRSGYVFALVGSVAVAVLLYLARFRLGGYLNDERLPALLIRFLPYLVAYAIARVSFGALRAHKRSLAAVVSRDFGPRIGALLLFGAFAYTGEAFFGAIVYWVVTPVLMACFAGYYLHRELTMPSVLSHLPDRETTRELWSFSWPLAIGASFFLILSNVDVLMIGYFMQPRSVGLYRAIQPLRQVTTFVLVAFTFLFLPLATEYYDDGNLDALDRFYTVTTKWVVAATFPSVLVFTLFAPDVVRVFFGGEYTPAAPALAVLTAGLFVRAIVGLNGDMTKAIDRPKIELYSVAVAVVINVVLNALLIPPYGIVGAAAATVVGYVVYNVLEVGAIYWAVGSHPFSLDSVKPLVPTLLFALGIVRLSEGVGLSLPVLVGIGVLVSMVHLVSMVLTRSLGREDLLLFEQFEDRTGLDLEWFKSLLRSYY